jgi:hypothetical protein
MRSLLIALSLLVLSAQAAYAVESVGQRWENSLLAHKRAGTCPAPVQARNACGPRGCRDACGTRPAGGI